MIRPRFILIIIIVFLFFLIPLLILRNNNNYSSSSFSFSSSSSSRNNDNNTTTGSSHSLLGSRESSLSYHLSSSSSDATTTTSTTSAYLSLLDSLPRSKLALIRRGEIALQPPRQPVACRRRRRYHTNQTNMMMTHIPIFVSNNNNESDCDKYNQKLFDIRIITASPQANGFYNASGIAGSLPMVYLLFARSFLIKCYKYNENILKLYEYNKSNWTFHGKGLW